MRAQGPFEGIGRTEWGHALTGDFPRWECSLTRDQEGEMIVFLRLGLADALK